MPSLDKAIAIANAEGVSLQWLATGEQEAPTSSGADTVATAQGITYIEKYNVTASAGGGMQVDRESIIDYYPFSTEFLKRNRISHCKLSIIEARGDSMEPTLESGDDIMIASCDNNAHKALQGIHVINLDGELRVKRLEYDIMNDGYRIISDNSSYKEEFVKRTELNRMRVIGEVVLVMGRPASQPASQED